MIPSYTLSFIILVTISLASSEAQVPYDKPLFISCGLPKSTTATSSTQEWKSDDDDSFAPPNINSISSITTSIDPNEDPPYDRVRVFQTQLTYSFFLTPGPKFIRLHFTPNTSYNNTPTSQYFVSVQGNNVTLFKNYSPQNRTYEFHLTVEKGSEKNLNLTFSPGDIEPNGNSNCKDNNCHGFINGIEIVPVPNGLYINLTNTAVQTAPRYVTNPSAGYTFSNSTALQNLYRLNVGGAFVDPHDDSGNMSRTWEADNNYLAPGGFQGQDGGLKYPTIPGVNYTNITPEYVAPKLVYATSRIMGRSSPESHLKLNITWRFEVNQGFNYLIRLHFCEREIKITGSSFRQFDVYINNQLAEQLDIFRLSGGLGVPIYIDYIIRIDGGGADAKINNATKVPLWLALHPVEAKVVDVLLNGLEIFRISEITGKSSYSLATPNPPQQPSPPPLSTSGMNSNHHPLLMIILSTIGGAILIFLLTLVCLIFYKRRAAKEDTTFGSKSNPTNTLSKYKWIPNMFHSAGSTASTMSSSLPSDLCHHFSFAQIKIATSDFDKNLIIGKGGFGEVYKGTLLGPGDESIQVAIKRLSSRSKQGAREFQTEIEMLSRLRHMHLVSLIGYCEEKGEMILVYEYMSHGTLRDHLMYKNTERNDHNKTTLSWKQRLMICLGSARGLHYLHAGAREVIIHRDVKSTNILLDDKWTAKVSDFGLSKAGPISLGLESGPAHISTAVKGSAGYLDPEYYRCHKLTEKSDVYSFGVVLFEVLCARAAVNPALPRDQANLAMWAQNHYKKGTLPTIVDPNISSQIAPECLRKFGEIAEMCVRDRGNERPSMADVVWSLEFALQLQETAEKNTDISGGSLEEVVGPISNIGDHNDGNTDTENFTFSRSSNKSVATKKLMDSKSTTSNSSDYQLNMNSASVFSEIIDPTAR